MKALKFEREKAKRLETIMIKAQKLQLYEEEKKARNQKEFEKKKEEEITEKEEKLKVEKRTNGNEDKVEVKIGDKGEKIEKIGTLNSASAAVIKTPLIITKTPVNNETVEEIKIEVKKEEEIEKEKAGVKEEEKEAQKNQYVAEDTQANVTAATAATTTTTTTGLAGVGVVVAEGVEVKEGAVKEVVKEVLKEGELSDGHASPEYGDSDGMEEDEEEDIDPEVEVGAKNVLLPSAEEDDDDALLKRRTLGQGFLRDIMAEYDRDRPTNKNSNSKSRSDCGVNGGADEGRQEQNSQQTSKTSHQLPSSTTSPSPSSITTATLTARDLGSDPRLSELLGALSASQQSCLKLWSPKKVSENAYTKVSVRTYIHAVIVI